MKRYLQLTRAHTVPLEAIPAYAGAVLGGAYPLGEWAMLALLFGTLYHLAGYGHNSLTDWEAGFDKEDEYKTHHPLNTGTIKPAEAKIITYTLILLTCFVGAVFVTNILTGVLLVVLVAAGLAYNYIGKETYAKPVFISIAHTSVFFFPYISVKGSVGVTGFLVATSMLLWVFYQIAVSGEILGIEGDDKNVARALGVETNYMEKIADSTGFDIPGAGPGISFRDDLVLFNTIRIRILGTCTRIAILLLFVGVTFSNNVSARMTGVIVILAGVAIWLNRGITSRGQYKRRNRMRKISAVEGINIFCLSLAIYPQVGLRGSVVLCLVSVVWLFSMNKIEWGTWGSPKV